MVQEDFIKTCGLVAGDESQIMENDLKVSYSDLVSKVVNARLGDGLYCYKDLHTRRGGKHESTQSLRGKLRNTKKGTKEKIEKNVENTMTDK